MLMVAMPGGLAATKCADLNNGASVLYQKVHTQLHDADCSFSLESNESTVSNTINITCTSSTIELQGAIP